MVFLDLKRTSGPVSCNFVEHEIKLEESAVPHREGARSMAHNQSDACRKEIENLIEYDRIETSKSPCVSSSDGKKEKIPTVVVPPG